MVMAGSCATGIVSSAIGKTLTAGSHRLFAPYGSHLPFSGPQQAVCGTASAGGAMCLIHVLSPSSSGAGPATVVSNPTGLAPSTIESVYGFSSSDLAGAGETIALVDAYNDPDAASDLATFDAKYGLPTPSFSQVNETGGTTLPASNSNWDLEISLDIEWAHALAPGAKILLVEATSSGLSDLLAAERYAGAHANVVSNSWGSSDFSGESSDDSSFTTPGVSYFAAAGDTGGQVLWPSASPDVTSVGGTSLTLTSGLTLAQESAWSGGGGGCSKYESANPAQKTGSVNCAGKRATPDISLDADPNSGVSVYDSVSYDGQSGWWTVGGTSASTAMMAAERASTMSSLSASALYASPPSVYIRDITLGSNGYSALPGYDLATGLGSWSNTPGAPVNLSATGEGASGVDLAWSAPTGAPVENYVIWRGTASGQETTEVATVPASGSSSYSYVDTTATQTGTTYYYEVEAVNSLGNGPFSSQAASGSVAPVARFSTSCSGATCDFTSTSTDSQGTISSYAWNGGNGVTGTMSTFADTYSAAGTYTVELTVKNTAAQSSSATAQVKCTSTRSGLFGRSTLTCT
jgi:subtilase family serine protease